MLGALGFDYEFFLKITLVVITKNKTFGVNFKHCAMNAFFWQSPVNHFIDTIACLLSDWPLLE